MKKSKTAWILLAPALLGAVAFFIIPFFISIYYSFAKATGDITLQNYINVLKSKAFTLAALNTIKFMITAIPLALIISFLLALLINKKLKGFKIFQTIILFPLTVPIATIVMFIQVFFADKGILNTIILNNGGTMHSFLQSDAAFIILVCLFLWKTTGYNVILMISGLNTISDELYQSAALDGASAWQKMRYITLPLMRPTFFLRQLCV